MGGVHDLLGALFQSFDDVWAKHGSERQAVDSENDDLRRDQ